MGHDTGRQDGEEVEVKGLREQLGCSQDGDDRCPCTGHKLSAGNDQWAHPSWAWKFQHKLQGGSATTGGSLLIPADAFYEKPAHPEQFDKF